MHGSCRFAEQALQLFRRDEKFLDLMVGLRIRRGGRIVQPVLLADRGDQLGLEDFFMAQAKAYSRRQIGAMLEQEAHDCRLPAADRRADGRPDAFVIERMNVGAASQELDHDSKVAMETGAAQREARKAVEIDLLDVGPGLEGGDYGVEAALRDGLVECAGRRFFAGCLHVRSKTPGYWLGVSVADDNDPISNYRSSITGRHLAGKSSGQPAEAGEDQRAAGRQQAE